MALAALGVLVTAVGGCTVEGAATFDPGGPCVGDAQQPGAYPDLEQRLPSSFDGAAPSRLDSGRNCSDETLGTLAGHGIDELRFAGALWETGGRSGVTIAIFSAAGLSLDRLAEFYETGARSARKTVAITSREVRIEGLAARRLDTLNDESFQTIVVLEGPARGLVRAVLVASHIRDIGTREAHEAVVDAAIEAATSP